MSLPPPGARFSGVEENLFFERFRPRPVQGLNSTFQLTILFENELPKDQYPTLTFVLNRLPTGLFLSKWSLKGESTDVN